MEFNRRGFDVFKEDVDVALKNVAKKHGVTIECGRISYDDFDFTMQLTVTKNDGKTDGKRMLFEQTCDLYGFCKDDYEREFTVDGKKFKLIGFNPKAPKNCCTIYCITDGHTYKCGPEMIKRAFAEQ